MSFNFIILIDPGRYYWKSTGQKVSFSALSF